MLASHKGEIPFVVYLLPFLAGIWLALTFDISGWQLSLTVATAILLTAFVLLNLLYGQTVLYRRQWAGGILTHLLLLMAGALVTSSYDNRNHETYFVKHPAGNLLVKVNSEPQLKNGFLRFTADAELSTFAEGKQRVSGSILLTIRTDSAHAGSVNYGDELLVPAKYNAVDPPFNPGEFNYKQYLAHQNIYMQAFVNPQDVKVINRDAGNPIVAYSLKLRRRLVGQFKVYMHSPEAIAVASTLILGYKAELDNDILQAYSKTGTIHVLSVSGAHMAIIFMMIGWLLGFMNNHRYGKIFKAALTIALIGYYALLTGFSPAVCRAAVMISLIIIGNTFARHLSTLNILAASAFGILVIDPFLIVDAGFQLSYLAIIGLVVFQPVVYSWWDIENKWLDKLWMVCSASMAIQAVTFPLSAYYFHQFPMYFLLSNLFIIVPVEVIMYAGIGCLGFALIGINFLAKAGGFILEKSILLMDRVLQFIELSPFSSAGKIWLTLTEFLILSALIVLLFCAAYYKKSNLLKAAAACMLVLCASLSAKRIIARHTVSITFMDLKKHSGILFKQGNRAVLLTDLADTDKNFRYSIQPCLDSNRVDALTIIPFEKDTANPFFVKHGPLIRFLNTDVLIMDKKTAYEAPAAKMKVDYIFVTGSPHPEPGFIDRCYLFRKVIADAANSAKSIDVLQTGLNNYDKKMYVLKRNKSLVIESD